jgi:hypothetical protein
MAALPTVIQTQARKQGYLSKGGKSLSGWKKRWFVLDDESLRYFTDNSVRSKPNIVCIEGRKQDAELWQFQKLVFCASLTLFL